MDAEGHEDARRHNLRKQLVVRSEGENVVNQPDDEHGRAREIQTRKRPEVRHSREHGKGRGRVDSDASHERRRPAAPAVFARGRDEVEPARERDRDRDKQESCWEGGQGGRASPQDHSFGCHRPAVSICFLNQDAVRSMPSAKLMRGS